jgi:hypothetical protein
MKLNKEKALVIISAIVILGFLITLALTYLPGKGETKLFFNADSDLPDPTLYLKVENRTKPIHELEVNETYNVIFSILSLENIPITYTYNVKSKILNFSERITLNPKEIKTITLKLEPKESEKWKLNFTVKEEWKSTIDLTENSWLAERRELNILVRKDGLPILVEENFHLPISTNVSKFGRILHANISIEELRRKPFEKEYVNKDERIFEKIETIDKITLSIKGEKLYLNAISTQKKYVSEPELFTIQLVKELTPEMLKELKISPNSFIQETQEIYFWYQLK